MITATLTHPYVQAEERHGSTEEHLRQLEGQLEEKNQEPALVRAPDRTFGVPLCPTVAPQGGL